MFQKKSAEGILSYEYLSNLSLIHFYCDVLDEFLSRSEVVLTAFFSYDLLVLCLVLSDNWHSGCVSASPLEVLSTRSLLCLLPVLLNDK